MTLIIRVATVILILSWSLQAAAQTDPGFDKKALYSAKYYKYKNMKTAGLIMTAGGAILGVVGLSKIASAPTTVNSQGQVVATGSDAQTGALMFLAAVPLVGVGIPFAIVGNAKSKKYNMLLEKSFVSGNFSKSRGAGFTITYKF